MTPGDVKNQHYVPQAYLRYFANNKGQICVYDKFERRRFVTNTRNVASENGFYDSFEMAKIIGDKKFVERQLSDLEGRYQTVIGSILRGLSDGSFKQVKPKDRHFLSTYLVIQMLRTRNSRDVSKSIIAAMDKILGHYATDSDGVATGGMNRESFGDLESDAREIQNHLLLNGTSIKQMAIILYRHIWVIQEAFGKEQFLTSDHPFVKASHAKHSWRSNSGIASPGIEISFPISPRFMLCLADRGHFAAVQILDGRRFRLDCHENMIYANQFQIYDSNRYIFCKDGDFSFVEQVLRENPEYGDPKRKKIAIIHGGVDLA